MGVIVDATGFAGITVTANYGDSVTVIPDFLQRRTTGRRRAMGAGGRDRGEADRCG